MCRPDSLAVQAVRLIKVESNVSEILAGNNMLRNGLRFNFGGRNSQFRTDGPKFSIRYPSFQLERGLATPYQ